LPKNWSWVLLSDVATLATGHTPSRKKPEYWDGEIPWMAVGDARKVHGKIITETKEYTNQLGIDNSAAVLLPAGTVCLSRTASIGYSVILGREMSTSQGFVNWICSDLLNPRFLQLIFMVENQFLNELAEGIAHTTIYFPEVKAFNIGLPSKKIQDLICKKVDKMFFQLDEVKTRLETIPEILTAFRQSVLNQAVTGKLTKEWRKGKDLRSEELVEEIKRVRKINWEKRTLEALKSKDKLPNNNWKKKYKEPFKVSNRIFFDIPKNWEELVWDQVSDWVTYGFTKPMPHTEDGIPIVTGKNVKEGRVNLDKFHFTSIDAFKSLNDKDRPIKGDLLITKDGTIGRAAIVDSEEPICINQSVAVAWLRNSPMNKSFLLYVVMSDYVQNEIKLHSKGVAIQHLSVTDFRKMQVPIPTIIEQEEIVKRVDSLFTKANQIQQRFESLLNSIKNLPKAILQKAFKGELVEQLPTDGDAKELLDEIKNLKEELKPKKKKTKK
jgi:type I restriction enzyme S subunit